MWHFSSTNSGMFQKSKLRVYTGSSSVKLSGGSGLRAQISLHTGICGKKYKGTVRKNSEECSSLKL